METTILVCSTGSTPHKFSEGLAVSRRGQLETFNYIIDLDGKVIEGKSWEPGDKIRVAYLGGILPDNWSTKINRGDTRTDEQKLSLVWLLLDLVYKFNIYPDNIQVLERTMRVPTPIQRRNGIEYEPGHGTGFSLKELMEEFEMILEWYKDPDDILHYIVMN